MINLETAFVADHVNSVVFFTIAFGSMDARGFEDVERVGEDFGVGILACVDVEEEEEEDDDDVDSRPLDPSTTKG